MFEGIELDSLRYCFVMLEVKRLNPKLLLVLELASCMAVCECEKVNKKQLYSALVKSAV